MGGIIGVLHTNDQPVSCENLQRMLDQQLLRGPAGQAIWQRGHIGLGHACSLTTPETLPGMLPFTSANGRYTLTCDARLDNRADLIAALALPTLPERPLSDGELLLAAFERWGADCLNRLLGVFAFAVWDAQQKTLFCARDQLGIKPFYYYWQYPHFALASNLASLLTLPFVSPQINERRILDQLLWHIGDTEITFYQHIYRLPPAHFLTLTAAGELRLRRYWSLQDAPDIRLNSDADYAAQFGEIFTEAVTARLRSAQPVGSFLSGGLDSSSVTIVARRCLAESQRGPLPTYSCVFPDVPESDESPFIAAVVEQGGVRPTYFRGDQSPTLPDRARLLSAMEEPFLTPNLFPIWHLTAQAQLQGIRVLLDGVDGDTALSHGMGALADLAYQQQWDTYQRELAGMLKAWWNAPSSSEAYFHARFGFPSLTQHARRGQWPQLFSSLNALARLGNTSRLRLLKNYVLRPFLPDYALRGWYWMRHGKNGFSPPEMINPDFAARWRDHVSERMKPALPAYSEREAHIRLVTAGRIAHVFEIIDRIGAAFGVEMRHPFYDRRVITFCVGLPVEQKVQQGVSRLVLRRAMQDALPAAILQRPHKAHLGYNLAHVFRTYEHQMLYDLVFQSADNPLLKYINKDVFDAHFHQLAHDVKGRATMEVWSVLVLGLWLNAKIG